jgi:hypothetical protein
VAYPRWHTGPLLRSPDHRAGEAQRHVLSPIVYGHCGIDVVAGGPD